MDFLEDLYTKRLKWIEANRENEFEEGIKNFLTELYPDNAHFIYELLQNAEDARASLVEFELSIDGLHFKHNGERQFTPADVESITSIGKSSKKDDFTQIGKFGVGFKAVFSYTNSPRIYSGKFAFEIKDLVCPVEIEGNAGLQNETVFWFPFNHPIKGAELALSEIQQTLDGLSDITVLFLRNIEEIRWKTTDAITPSSLKRTKSDRPDIWRIVKSLDQSTTSLWLRFTKDVPESPGLFVAVAFRLASTKKGDANSVVKIDNKVEKGAVSIFFPAEKENSNLRFNLHAPFSATIARDSIQSRTENGTLRDLLVELVVESLPKIKKLRLLDRSFLEILPNRKDALSEFYSPFRDRIIEVFSNDNFTPCKKGFLPSKKLLQANNEIKNVINSETILTYLTGREDIDWAIGLLRGTRSYDFLESLNIEEWTFKELLEKVGDCFKATEDADRILAPLQNEWFERLYALLGKALDESNIGWQTRNNIEHANIVRLQNRSHRTAKRVYFESELVRSDTKISIVDQGTYRSKSGKISEKAVQFLTAIGVKKFEPADEIKILLNRYYKKGEPDFLKVSDEEHIRHLRKFVRFLKDFSDRKGIFANYYVLRVATDTRRKSYDQPRNIFVDSPFQHTRLTAVREHIHKQKLWKGYESEIKNQKEFLLFLKEIGLTFGLVVKETTVHKNPMEGELKLHYLHGAGESQYYRINDDYEIDNLDEMLESADGNISLLVWETMCRSDRKIFEARYRPNSNYPTRTAPSKVTFALRNKRWIPTVDGSFMAPDEMWAEKLARDFPFDNRNGWLTAINFGINNNPTASSAEQKDRLAKQLKISAEELEYALEFARMSSADKKAFAAFRNERMKSDRPGDGGQNGGEDDSNASQETPQEFVPPTLTDQPPSEATLFAVTSRPSNVFGPYRPVDLRVNFDDLDESAADDAEEESIRNQGLAETVTYQLVKSRIGQGDFRANLERIEKKCRLTNVGDGRFLIASHIKPWRFCSNHEKLDGNNGLLLSPHVDLLFDKGWISFTDEGVILYCDPSLQLLMKSWGIDPELVVGSFNQSQRIYLAYHRENRFRGLAR